MKDNHQQIVNMISNPLSACPTVESIWLLWLCRWKALGTSFANRPPGCGDRWLTEPPQAQGLVMLSLNPYHSQTVRSMNPAPPPFGLPSINSIFSQFYQSLEECIPNVKEEKWCKCNIEWFFFGCFGWKCSPVSWTLKSSDVCQMQFSQLSKKK